MRERRCACDRVLRHSILPRTRITAFLISVLYNMPTTFTPTAEQLALREARRLKKEKTAANAGVSSSSLVNNRIVPRPWLALQDSPTNATHTTKIMTWNVRNFNFFFCSCVHSVGWITISAFIQLFPALSPVSRP